MSGVLGMQWHILSFPNFDFPFFVLFPCEVSTTGLQIQDAIFFLWIPAKMVQNKKKSLYITLAGFFNRTSIERFRVTLRKENKKNQYVIGRSINLSSSKMSNERVVLGFLVVGWVFFLFCCFFVSSLILPAMMIQFLHLFNPPGGSMFFTRIICLIMLLLSEGFL